MSRLIILMNIGTDVLSWCGSRVNSPVNIATFSCWRPISFDTLELDWVHLTA